MADHRDVLSVQYVFIFSRAGVMNKDASASVMQLVRFQYLMRTPLSDLLCVRNNLGSIKNCDMQVASGRNVRPSSRSKFESNRTCN